MPPTIPVLHAVTSDEVVLRPGFRALAERVMRTGGPRIAVHLRAPQLGGRRLHALARELAGLQEDTGAWLAINDRADIALASGARAVQLTSRSVTSADARRFAPAIALGASVHSDEDATSAATGGADWLVAGYAFDSMREDGDGEPNAAASGVDFVRRLARLVTIPVITIGGVRPEHVSSFRHAGAYGVAVIRGVWQASDAEAAVIDYLTAHDAHGVS